MQAIALEALVTFPRIHIPILANTFLFLISLLLLGENFQKRINVLLASSTGQYYMEHFCVKSVKNFHFCESKVKSKYINFLFKSNNTYREDSRCKVLPFDP